MALKLGYAFNRFAGADPVAAAPAVTRKNVFSDLRVSENNPATAKQPPTTPVAAKVKQQPAQAQDAAAPLPRQNSKTTPPSPPAIIRDLNRLHAFTRLGFLGEVRRRRRRRRRPAG